MASLALLLLLSIGTASAASTEAPTGTPGLPHRELTQKDLDIAWLACLAFFVLLVGFGVPILLVVQDVKCLYSEWKAEKKSKSQHVEKELLADLMDGFLADGFLADLDSDAEAGLNDASSIESFKTTLDYVQE